MLGSLDVSERISDSLVGPKPPDYSSQRRPDLDAYITQQILLDCNIQFPCPDADMSTRTANAAGGKSRIAGSSQLLAIPERPHGFHCQWRVGNSSTFTGFEAFLKPVAMYSVCSGIGSSSTQCFAKIAGVAHNVRRVHPIQHDEY